MNILASSKGWLHQITPKGIIKCTCIANIPWGENWVFNHDDVIKGEHFPCYCIFVQGIHQSLENSSHKGQWPEALMFSLICAWINGWVNNREAGSFRRHHDHYDITIMTVVILFKPAKCRGSLIQNQCSPVALKNWQTSRHLCWQWPSHIRRCDYSNVYSGNFEIASTWSYHQWHPLLILFDFDISMDK